MNDDDDYAPWNPILPTQRERLEGTKQAFIDSYLFNKKLYEGWDNQAWAYKVWAAWAKDKANTCRVQMMEDFKQAEKVQAKIDKLGASHG